MGMGHGAWGALPMPYAHACQTVSQCGLGVSPSRATGVSVSVALAGTPASERASPEGRGVDWAGIASLRSQ